MSFTSVLNCTDGRLEGKMIDMLLNENRCDKPEREIEKDHCQDCSLQTLAVTMNCAKASSLALKGVVRQPDSGA